MNPLPWGVLTLNVYGRRWRFHSDKHGFACLYYPFMRNYAMWCVEASGPEFWWFPAYKKTDLAWRIGWGWFTFGMRN